MDVSQAVKQRISTRAFLDTPISQADLGALLSAAQRAPSGGNLQPWRVIAVAGAAKDEITTLAQSKLAANPRGEPTDRPIYPEGLWEPHKARRFKVGEMMYEQLGIPRDDKPARLIWFANNFRFFGAPVALFFVIDERMGHGQLAHMGMFMQTIALLAEERGWGTCMQECWGILRPSLKSHFKLDSREMVYCGMSLGVPDAAAPVNKLYTERAQLNEFTSFDGF
ncbi:MAG: nitroreductase [Pseudomonadota bacterium]